MKMLSLKQKMLVLTGLTVLLLLILSTIFFMFYGQINDLHHTKENMLVIEKDILLLRRNEKDFLMRKMLKYKNRFFKNHSLLKEKILELEKNLKNLDISTETAESLEKISDQYGEYFKELTEAQIKIGLDEKSGLLGKLRKAVHEAEENLKKSNNILLTKDMLMLRRNEKDFLARKDLKYKKRFTKNFNIFVTHLKNAKMSPEKNRQLFKDIKTYRDNFFGVIEASVEMGLNSNLGVIGKMRKTIHQVEDISNTLKKVLDTTLSEKESTNQRLIIIIVIAMSILSCIITFFIAQNYIISPITTSNKKLYESSGAINSASSQISSSAQELSSGASELASSVEEITASMEELHSTIETNTKIANQGAMLSKESLNLSSQNQSKMDRMKKALEEIHEQSQKIVKINSTERYKTCFGLE